MTELLSARYELDGVIGHGDMSVVYRGHDLQLDRIVAIKALRIDLARDQIFWARFRSEVQPVASLNHSSIIAVYDLGEDVVNSTLVPYIVMEYVDGPTLRDLLREERPPWGRALEIIDEVLCALDHIHRNGIVHRHINSAVVMLTHDGDVKVMGFGAARLSSDPDDAQADSQAVGTVDYLPPEPTRDARIDARSDLYSAGCLLYELLTGRSPFIGDAQGMIIDQRVREDLTPPSQVDRQVPSWVDLIVLKAMAKNPADRYQTAAKMRADIWGRQAGRGNLLDVREEVFANLAEQGPQFWIEYKKYKQARNEDTQAPAAVGPREGAPNQDVFASLAEQGPQFWIEYEKYKQARDAGLPSRPKGNLRSVDRPPPSETRHAAPRRAPPRRALPIPQGAVRANRRLSQGAQPDDPVSVAVREALKPGLLTFNPPAVMIQGRWERVEIAIARSTELREALTAGLRGKGEPQFESISTSPFMSVELSGPAFMVRSFSPMEQLIPQIGRWEFDVRPIRAGRQTLTLCVSLRIDSPTVSGHIAVPVFERNIRIRVDVGFSTRRFFVENWQWLIATALGLGGVLAAWITLFH